MARTPSTMLRLGTQAPGFSLPEPASGKTVASTDFSGRPLLVMFICNHCPFVIHVRAEMQRMAADYQARGIAVVAINANDADHYPDDSPEKMIEEVRQHGYTFPYLYDETQDVAKAYKAACTPDFFLYDKNHQLAYRGQFDDSRPQSGIPVTGADLRAACDAVLAGKPVPEPQKPSIGCNIKWKSGNEPEYFTGQPTA